MKCRAVGAARALSQRVGAGVEAVPCATQGIDTMKQRISATIVAFALTSLGTASAHPGQDVYQMDDGLLVIEFESAQVVSDWSLEQAIPGSVSYTHLRAHET